MKLPRDVSGEELANRLTRLGYQCTRQTGSHMRLTNETMTPQHHITVPKHASIKVGTLNAILRDVAEHRGISKEDIIRELWG